MKKIKVLLIQPPYASLRGILPTPISHVGLLYLSAHLQKHQKDCKVLIADMYANIKPVLFVFMQKSVKGSKDYKDYITGKRDHVVWKNIENIIKDCKPDIVGITSTTPEIDATHRVASLVKKINPNIRTILGGAHATLLPDEALKDENIDFLIRGEGEIPLLQFIHELEEETFHWEKIPSLSYKTDQGKITHNQHIENISNIDDLPFPAIDTMITPAGFVPKEHSVIASRGCLYRCSFCADKNMWGKIRQRSSINVADELEWIIKQYPQTKEIYFIDGTLTYNKKFIKELCGEIRKRNIKLTFYCTARFDNIDEEMLNDMKSAGFKYLYLGAESGDADVLKKMNKGVTPEIIEEKVKLIKKSGIISLVSILVGIPGETKTSLKNTLDLMKRIKADSFAVNSFVPLPGSEWYKQMSDEVKNNINWLEIGYREKHPYLLRIEEKTQLYKYVAKIYRIADQRLLETIVRKSLQRIAQSILSVLRINK